MFESVLIANRGEIAARVVRTCRELGVRAVAVHSEPDAAALHVRLADHAVLLPGAVPALTYLNIDLLVRIALENGCQAVHPGYGFLAENAAFSAAVRSAGLSFIGPSPEAITTMGEKVGARAAARRAEVPVVPGSDGAVLSEQDILSFGSDHGYPLLVKASYGGGGRGMRTVEGADQVAEAFAAAQREAQGAFGRADVYVECYLPAARHVEVQVFADRHGNTVYLGDRDCSVQRRHQKVVEESPAPGLADHLRRRMGEAAVRLAQAVRYEGAGTVEFLAEPDRDAFYFLEMNTRIQVEHPVTEQVLGMDLIAEQIAVAAGEPLSVTQSGPMPRGHAIEVRLNAEDVTGGAFRPSPGTIHVLDIPHRPGIRWDAAYQQGDTIPPFYDSLLGKLVCWAPTREHAITRMLQALDDVRVAGVPTTAPVARIVLQHPDFRSMTINTNWLESTVDLGSLVGGNVDDQPDDDGPDTAPRSEVWVAGRRYIVPFFADDGATNGQPTIIGVGAGVRRQDATASGRRGGTRRARGSGSVTSPMQGTVIAVPVTVGATVAVGDLLIVLEAMKMENPIRATIAGTVRDITATIGQVVAAGDQLARIEPLDPRGGDDA